jgi:hypothetical protein
MQLASYDTYNEINFSNNSAVGVILEYMGDADTIDDILQTEQLKQRFAINYSNAKKEMFLQNNLIDFKFCIFNNSIFKTTDALSRNTYQAPTNFIRFLKNDKERNNALKIAKSNSKGMESIFFGNFDYIGYVKDSHPDIKIPNPFYTMVACKLLRTMKVFKDNLSPQDEALLIQKSVSALQELKSSYF